MLGLLLRERYPYVRSAWLAHCEKGDFYEWIGRMALGRGITEEERKVIKLLVMRMLYTAIKPTEAQDETPFWWYLKTYLKEKDASKKEHLATGKLFKSFDFIVMSYLRSEEPKLYELVYEHRTNLLEVKRRKPTAKGKMTKKRNNLSIEMTKMEGFESLSDHGITVVIDKNLTPELIEEGNVREIISKIQTMRKDSGFEVMDNIRLSFSGNEKIAAIAERNKNEIMSDTLTVEILYNVALAHSKEWNINGENVTISVEKL
jgi:hypothetical protein